MDVATNSIQVREGGTVTAKVATNPTVEKEARLMYDGMTGVLSASRPLEGVQVHELGPGVCGYTFTLPLDTAGLTLAWTMADDKQQGFSVIKVHCEQSLTFCQPLMLWRKFSKPRHSSSRRRLTR